MLLLNIEGRLGVRAPERKGNRGFGTFLSAKQDQHNGEPAIFVTLELELRPSHYLDGCGKTMSEVIYKPANPWSSQWKQFYIVTTSRCHDDLAPSEVLGDILGSFREE